MKYDVVRLFRGGEFSSHDLEIAVIRDAKKHKDTFFGSFLNDEMREWRDCCDCSELLGLLFENAFMFGACSVIEDGQSEDYGFAAVKYRPLYFRQLIVPNDSLREWISVTGCMDFIYALYKESFVYGAYFMENIVSAEGLMFERNE